MEIRTNTITLATPFVVQHVATTSPLKGGTCLEIIPLPIHIFTIHVQVTTTTTTTKRVESNNKSIKEKFTLLIFHLVLYLIVEPNPSSSYLLL
jgi:hypothetical protein